MVNITSLANILKVDFLAQSKLYFRKFCTRLSVKIPEKSHKSEKKTGNKNVKIVKMYYFSSLGVDISIFCANSATFCTVSRLYDGII